MAGWKKLQSERIVHDQPKAVVYRLTGVLTDTKEAFELLGKQGLAPVVNDGSWLAGLRN